MATWRDVMTGAEKAKSLVRTDPLAGEAAFDELLLAHPSDGMVFFKRAEAREAAGDLEGAAADYEQAERLFPQPDWKNRAQQGRLRVRS